MMETYVLLGGIPMLLPVALANFAQCAVRMPSDSTISLCRELDHVAFEQLSVSPRASGVLFAYWSDLHRYISRASSIADRRQVYFHEMFHKNTLVRFTRLLGESPTGTRIPRLGGEAPTDNLIDLLPPECASTENRALTQTIAAQMVLAAAPPSGNVNQAEKLLCDSISEGLKRPHARLFAFK